MHTFDDWVLTGSIFIPMIGAAVLMILPRENELWLKGTALLASLVTLGFGVYLLANFDYDNAKSAQFELKKTWIEVINSKYHVFVDGISLPLLLLSMFIVVLCIFYSWDHF